MTFSEISFGVVILCWFIFAGAFLFRKKPPPSTIKTRSGRARAGLILQAIAYSLVWAIRRPAGEPIVSSPVLGAAGGAVAIGLAAGSIWLTIAAVRRLGKQWALAAQISEDHELITDGPYSVVRNPIYAGMFGMLIATGLVVSNWIAIPPAILLYYFGTHIRVRSEEKLLVEKFGAAFEEYTSRVPAYIPRITR